MRAQRICLAIAAASAVLFVGAAALSFGIEPRPPECARGSIAAHTTNCRFD
ncbi:hypothetical protein ACQR1Y_11945 [Bradyrhizobium sp. HKCCYLRH3099]|uniref:hypothetical protein n=1 Tax=unclassified Bradyrhizobium TaxID=2631580 RepID=UPI003EBE429F